MNSRIKNVRKLFVREKIDAIIIFKKTHIRYLTGLKPSADLDAFLIIFRDRCYLITDCRYEEDACFLAKQHRGLKVIMAGDRKTKKIGNVLAERKERRIGFDAELGFGQATELIQMIKNKTFIPVCGLIEEVSAIKDAEEIKNIKMAQKITEEVFEKRILPIIRPGIKELDLAAEISYWHKKLGAEGDSFSPIVLSGAKSSLPHGEPGDNKIKKGDILQFDFGCIFNGYCSDFSRVVIVGKRPDEEQKEIYNIVLKALQAAIKAVRPSMEYGQLDLAARNFIIEQGYGDQFNHSLGHGVGIEIHVPPFVGSGNKEIMRPGHVITIEPGIYIPGWGGMRIEDIVLITKNGIEPLTKFSKKLISV